MTTADTIAGTLRPIAPGRKLTHHEVELINLIAAEWDARRSEARTAPRPVLGIATPHGPEIAPDGQQAKPAGRLTVRVALELIGHEAIVQEAYKDSVGVWTWGIGVTTASGHSVERYKDHPQSIRKCIEVYVWLLRNKYIPAVERAFQGHPMTEARFAAALSFHYNTGAIGKAEWVRSWLDGDDAKARQQIMNWRLPPEIIPRREKERDLFFDGKWSQDGKATVYPVKKPSYTPDWGKAKRADVTADVAAVIAESAR